MPVSRPNPCRDLPTSPFRSSSWLTTAGRGGLAQPGRDPAGRRPARHRGRGHPLRRPAGRRPGDPLLRAGHHDRRARRRSTTTTSRPSSRSPPTARWACTTSASARPPASASCAPSASGPCRKSTRSSRTTTSPAPQAIPMNVTVNGVADNEDVDYFVVEAKKGERISAEIEGMRLGDHVLRSLRRDPGRQAVRAGLQRRRGADLAGRLRLDRRPGGRQVHHPGPRERLRRQRLVPLPAARRQFPAAHGGAARRRQARREARGALARRRGGRGHDRGHPAGGARARLRPVPPGRRRASRPIPNTFRLTTLGNVIEKEPNDDQAAGHAVRAPDGAQRRDRQAGRRRPLRLHRPRRARSSTSASSPGRSARRSIR